ncbi:hypothetical protein BDW22DRAFT_1402801 [Trametopsis cervina]|nr:hypothetical protein BDW22DRAFT_1402801 [Trametopsis cervina]
MSRLLKRLGRHTVEETKAYELLPNPEPLESDNDPLFDSAAFAPTPPRKKGRKLRSIPQPPAEESAEHVGRSNKSAGAAIHITRRDKPRVPRTHTPFAQYFAGLSMKLASDDEMQEEGDLEEDTSGSHADDESDRDWPAVSLGSGMNTRKEISDSSQVTDSSKILRVSVGLSAARRNISKGRHRCGYALEI